MKQNNYNKYREIAHKMGFSPAKNNLYGNPKKTGLQGVAMYLLDEIENINERRANKDILNEYELMKNFFDEMKQYFK